MARNLQKKLPSDDVLLVQDINADATARFLAESKSGAQVKIAKTVGEASNGAVRLLLFLEYIRDFLKNCDPFGALGAYDDLLSKLVVSPYMDVA